MEKAASEVTAFGSYGKHEIYLPFLDSIHFGFFPVLIAQLSLFASLQPSIDSSVWYFFVCFLFSCSLVLTAFLQSEIHRNMQFVTAAENSITVFISHTNVQVLDVPGCLKLSISLII